MLPALSLKTRLTDPRSIDGLNIALIILTCGAAHLYPYHLLIISYTILGPAHYLTQISWLHDRNYFMKARGPAILFVILTAAFIFAGLGSAAAIALMAAVFGALALVVSPRLEIALIAATAGGLIGGLITHYLGTLALFIILLLPTVLHVFVFTASFMWVGAVRSGHRTAYIAFFTLLIGAATFLLPAEPQIPPQLLTLAFFQPVVDYLRGLLPGTTGTHLFGFLGYAYTYHYLNWFSKAEIIRWNKIPKRRLYGIAAAYLFFESIYAINNAAGFIAILFLSVLHVLLEFPLNLRTFGTLGSAVLRRRPSS